MANPSAPRRRTLPIGRCRFALPLALAIGVALFTGCGDSASSNDAASSPAAAPTSAPDPARRTFVGQIADTKAFVAVIAEGGKAWAYLCDGQGQPTDQLFSYLDGTIAATKISAAGDDGSALTGSIDGDAVTGTVTLPGGGTRPFTATAASGTAGWFTAAVRTATTEEVGSWIRLGDGQVRGKVVATTQGAGGGGGTEPTDPTQLGGAGTVPPTAQPTPTGLFKCIRATRALADAAKVYNTTEPLTAAHDQAEVALDAARDARNAACGL